MTPAQILPDEIVGSLTRKEPLLWLNPNWQPIRVVRDGLAVSRADVEEAGRNLDRFASLLEMLFPELLRVPGLSNPR